MWGSEGSRMYPRSTDQNNARICGKPVIPTSILPQNGMRIIFFHATAHAHLCFPFPG